MSCRLQPWVPEVEADQVELPEVGTVAAVAVEEVRKGGNANRGNFSGPKRFGRDGPKKTRGLIWLII